MLQCITYIQCYVQRGTRRLTFICNPAFGFQFLVIHVVFVGSILHLYSSTQIESMYLVRYPHWNLKCYCFNFRQSPTNFRLKKIRKSNHRCARLSELSVLLLYLYYCLALYLHYCITGISSLQMLFPTIYRWYNFTPNISRRIPMRYTYLTKNLDEL